MLIDNFCSLWQVWKFLTTITSWITVLLYRDGKHFTVHTKFVAWRHQTRNPVCSMPTSSSKQYSKKRVLYSNSSAFVEWMVWKLVFLGYRSYRSVEAKLSIAKSRTCTYFALTMMPAGQKDPKFWDCPGYFGTVGSYDYGSKVC